VSSRLAALARGRARRRACTTAVALILGGSGRLRSYAASASRALATLAIVVIGSGSSVFACPVCFGAEETSLVDGTKLGVFVMLAILLAVQGGFVAFFLYLRKRAKRFADIELDTEWSDLQRGPRTS
jgi:hypothetical protein